MGSMSVCELPKLADTAWGLNTTHKAKLFDHRLKGVIVSNFIPLLSYSE